MDQVVFRTARESDVDGIMAVEAEAFGPAIRESRAVFGERVRIFPEGFLVADSGGAIAGYVSSELLGRGDMAGRERYALGHSIRERHDPDGKELYVSSFAIRAARRGTGFGRSLWREFESHASRTIDPETVTLIVADAWTAARRIYLGAGFRETETIPGFFAPGDSPAGDAIVMRRGRPFPETARAVTE